MPAEAPPPAEPPIDPKWTLHLPPRPRDAETGSQFIERTAAWKRPEFEKAVLESIESGNVPSFLRRMVPVQLNVEVRGKRHQAVAHVIPDYLSIGSDEDFLRIPMCPCTAQKIASALGCVLPTPKLVDEIWRQAANKLPPKWIDGGPNVEDHWDYKRHNSAVEEQRALRRLTLGPLTAGDMKDIVLTNQLAKHRNKVAIYGWHRESGRPIQPLTTVHSKNYADYSHGVRLVSDILIVDGQEVAIQRVMKDRMLSALVSNDGPLVITSYPL